MPPGHNKTRTGNVSCESFSSGRDKRHHHRVQQCVTTKGGARRRTVTRIMCLHIYRALRSEWIPRRRRTRNEYRFQVYHYINNLITRPCTCAYVYVYLQVYVCITADDLFGNNHNNLPAIITMCTYICMYEFVLRWYVKTIAGSWERAQETDESRNVTVAWLRTRNFFFPSPFPSAHSECKVSMISRADVVRKLILSPTLTPLYLTLFNRLYR
jgi:hypothetical protein